MNTWINKITGYLNKFLELGVLLLAVSVIAEILFGPNVAFLVHRLLPIWLIYLKVLEIKV